MDNISRRFRELIEHIIFAKLSPSTVRILWLIIVLLLFVSTAAIIFDVGGQPYNWFPIPVFLACLFFRQRGSLASVLQQFGPALYHRCHKRRLEYSFCQYNWLVAWDSASREFYPFREQNRAIPDGLRRSPS